MSSKTSGSKTPGSKTSGSKTSNPITSDPSPRKSIRPAFLPETRASYAHLILRELEESPRLHRSVLARAGDAAETIANTHRSGWLDATTYDTLTEAVRSELGDPETRVFFRKVGRRLTSIATIQRLLETALRLIGTSPHSTLKQMPRGRDSLVRNSGHMTYHRVDDRHCRLRLLGFPASTFRTGTTTEILAGACLGLIDLAGKSGEVEVIHEDLEAGEATFDCTW